MNVHVMSIQPLVIGKTPPRTSNVNREIRKLIHPILKASGPSGGPAKDIFMGLSRIERTNSYRPTG